MAHIHELYDFVVSAFIVDKDAEHVLLCNHAKLKMWLPVGGHVELNENTDQALYREIKEETGLDVRVKGTDNRDIEQEYCNDHSPKRTALLRPEVMEMHPFNQITTPGHKHINMIYFAQAEDSTLAPADGELNGLKWFTFIEVIEAKDIDPFVQKYALAALSHYFDEVAPVS